MEVETIILELKPGSIPAFFVENFGLFNKHSSIVSMKKIILTMNYYAYKLI